MKYTFNKMSQESALTIADKWHYEEPYSFYDALEDMEDYQELISPELRNNNYFEAKIDQELVGFFSIFKEKEEDQIEIGLGLRPDLCGKGLGKALLNQVEEYVISIYHPSKFILSVAAFNNRAIKVYQSCGYRIVGEENRETNNTIYRFIQMERKILY